MQRIDWTLLVSREIFTIIVVLCFTGAAARRCLRHVREAPARRAETLFRLGQTVAGLPFTALVPAFALWEDAVPPTTPGFAQGCFSVGWTGYVVAWSGSIWIYAAVIRAARPDAPRPGAVVCGNLYAWGSFVLAPLLAGWAAVAFATVRPSDSSGVDPTEALAFALGNLVATSAITWFLRRRTSNTTALPDDVAADFARAAGDGGLPEVVVAPLARIGLPGALAFRHRGRPRISVDGELIASFPTAEATAILLHELGHHRLGHIRRRAWTAKVGLIVVLLVPTFLGWGHVAVFVVGAGLLGRFVLLPQWRRQEFEADRFAADRSDARTIASALVRIHRGHDVPDDFGKARNAMTHPDLVRRLEALGVPLADVAPAAA